MLTRGKDGSVEFSELDPVHGIGKTLVVLPAETGRILDWDVSPDHSSLVLGTNTGTPLQLISLNTGKTTAVASPGFQSAESVNWTADGKGFFVSSPSAAGHEMSFVNLRGSSTLLRSTSVGSWLVPSPNGKHVAFMDQSYDSNVWLLQQK